MLQDRLGSLEYQSTYEQKLRIEYETKLKTVQELFENLKSEYDNACSKIADVNNSKINFEILCEHRLATIRQLEREIKMKEEKSIEFRNRFDLATQKLLDKDNRIRDLLLEKDKIEAQLKNFKEKFVNNDEKPEDDPKDTEQEKQRRKKQSWLQKREKEEKSFVDANDYILVCK